MPNEYYHPIPWWGIVLIAVIVMTQSMWLFTDARRRQKNRWFWGIWGLTTCPMPILLYTYFHIYRPYRKAKQHIE